MIKKIKFFLFVVFIVLLSNTAFSQDQSVCKVLLDSIAGKYEGQCKDNLAHGKGISIGIDTYEGYFKKGLPDGTGKYTWANGDYYDGNWKHGKRNGEGMYYKASENTEFDGKWKNNELVRIIPKPGYKLLSSVNVNNVSIRKVVNPTPGTIRIIFKGNPNVEYYNTLELKGSNGVATKTQDYIAFTNVSYPFEGLVSFVQTGNFIISVRSEVKFIINEPDSWEITIYYGQAERSVGYDRIM